MSSADERGIALLAPMRLELWPLIRSLSLRPARLGNLAVHTGDLAGRPVVASAARIGPEAAARTTEELLRSTSVNQVVLVGIAGGVDPRLAIGDVVVPSVVVSAATGAEYTPSLPAGVAPEGRLLTTEDLQTGEDVLALHRAEHVTAVDMETAAVAEVCEREGVAWSAFRAISDRLGDGLVDPAMLRLVRADGTPDALATARYLLARPSHAWRLARVARDTRAAAAAAARAALDAWS